MASAAPAFSLHSKLPKHPSSPYTTTQLRPQSSARRSLSRCLAVDRKDDGLRFVFTGGGTGGHIYPAIAIADEIRTVRPDSRFLFVGSSAGIESSAVVAAGYDFAAAPPSRLTRPLPSPQNLFLLFHLIRSLAASWRILRRFRPHVVVGTGGYVAFPVCLVAALSGPKLFVQEQNGTPGLTNRAIAPFAEKVFLACVKYFPKDKCEVRGNPIRLALRRYVSKADARSRFFPKAARPRSGDDKPQVVLVLGGSAGANAVNITMLSMYYDMLSEQKNRFVIWQTGAEGYNEMESLVKNHRRLLVTPFLHEMDLAYAAADVVVSRAGAMTCTEILTTGKPSILIPSPNVVDDHQTNNAYIMAEIAGSKVLEEDELDSNSLEIAINEILGNENLMAEMSEKALSVARPDAATEIAQCILSHISLSSPK